MFAIMQGCLLGRSNAWFPKNGATMMAAARPNRLPIIERPSGPLARPAISAVHFSAAFCVIQHEAQAVASVRRGTLHGAVLWDTGSIGVTSLMGPTSHYEASSKRRRPGSWHTLGRHNCEFCSRFTLDFVLLFCWCGFHLLRPAFHARPPTGAQVGRPDAGYVRRCIPSWFSLSRTIYLRATISNVILLVSTTGNCALQAKLRRPRWCARRLGIYSWFRIVVLLCCFQLLRPAFHVRTPPPGRKSAVRVPDLCAVAPQLLSLLQAPKAIHKHSPRASSGRGAVHLWFP